MFHFPADGIQFHQVDLGTSLSDTFYLWSNTNLPSCQIFEFDSGNNQLPDILLRLHFEESPYIFERNEDATVFYVHFLNFYHQAKVKVHFAQMFFYTKVLLFHPS